MPLATVAAAQTADRDPRFEDTAEVIEVRVPVNVVDRDGLPVRGLTAEQFEIFDEGERQEILGFEVFDLEELEPGESRSEVDRALPSAARRHFLLLFDLSFSSPSALLRARRAARAFVVDTLHPTDLVAVATHSLETGSQLVVTFTPDRGQVARAIDTLGAPRMLHLAQRDPLRFVIDDPLNSSQAASSDLSDLQPDSTVNQLTQSVEAYLRVIGKQVERMEKSFARGRISSWANSMGELARYLDSVKGRKHVVFLSEGFDGRLLLGRQPDGEDLGTQTDMRNLQFGNFWMVDTDDIFGNAGLQSDVAQMLEEFRRADCVIQTVDISGLRADTAAVYRARRVGQDALFYVANETGGALFEDANNFGEQLERLLARSNVTYLLTFRPSRLEADGSYHRLRVRADLPRGSRISHRRGYYAPRPYEELHPIERSLLASDAIASVEERSDLKLNVLAAPFRANDDQAYVPVIVEVDGPELVAGHQSLEMAVEFYAYVTDRHGAMKDFFTQLVNLDLRRTGDLLRQKGLKYYGHLTLPPGDYLIRVLVRNSETGRSGVKAAPLEIPAFELAAPTLLPPFFVEGAAEWLLVRERLPELERQSVVYPFTVNGQPYVPAALPALRVGDEAEMCLVAYNLGDGDLRLDGTIMAEDGSSVDGGALALIDRTVTGIEGLDKLLATFRPDGLPAGRYTLQVALTDLGSGSVQRNSIPFEVPLN